MGRYNVLLSPIAWAYTENDPWGYRSSSELTKGTQYLTIKVKHVVSIIISILNRNIECIMMAAKSLAQSYYFSIPLNVYDDTLYWWPNAIAWK